MKIIGRMFGILALIAMILGLVPLLGWLNWFIIPFAILGLILSLIGKSTGGTVLCVLAIIVGMVRLLMGGGIV